MVLKEKEKKNAMSIKDKPSLWRKSKHTKWKIRLHVDKFLLIKEIFRKKKKVRTLHYNDSRYKYVKVNLNGSDE